MRLQAGENSKMALEKMQMEIESLQSEAENLRDQVEMQKGKAIKKLTFKSEDLYKIQLEYTQITESLELK